MGRRVLVTGADTFWGGRMIQALEADPGNDVILGMSTHNPGVPFDRVEFVRADETYSILDRIVVRRRLDTIIHTFLVVDSTLVASRALHEYQRDRHHEPTRRRRRPRFAGVQR